MNESRRTSGEVVVLLHGFGRSRRSMQPLAVALSRRSYRVVNRGYPSRTAPLGMLAAAVGRQIAQVPSDGPLHFVTHSIGGMLLRVAVATGMIPLERVGRVVMLGPPNTGSEIVDALTRRRLAATQYRDAAGMTGLQLGAEPHGLPGYLPPVPFEVGVIAGNRAVNPIFSALSPRPNDPKVEMTRSTVPGMREMIVLPIAQPLLASAPSAVAHTVRFIETGTFHSRADTLPFTPRRSLSAGC